MSSSPTVHTLTTDRNKEPFTVLATSSNNPRESTAAFSNFMAFDTHTWITITYGGALPNFEECCITHGALFLIGLDEDTSEFPNPSLIHPSLRPSPATNNSDSDTSDYNTGDHDGIILSRRAFNLAGLTTQNADRIYRECSSAIKRRNICQCGEFTSASDADIVNNNNESCSYSLPIFQECLFDLNSLQQSDIFIPDVNFYDCLDSSSVTDFTSAT